MKSISEKSRKDILFILLGILVPVGFFCIYAYTDIILTTAHSLNIWYTLTDKKSICEFYNIQYPLISNLPPAYYDFFIYIIFAIWNIPTFIFEKITGISFACNYFSLLYAKSIIMFFLLLSIKKMYQICLNIYGNKNIANFGALIFVYSVTLFQTIFVTGNYDIISVYFTLTAVLAYFEKKYTKYYIFISAAIACKMFAFLIFVPLELLRDTKIRNKIMGCIYALAAILIPKIAFSAYAYLNDVEINKNPMSPAGGNISHLGIIYELIWSGEAPIFVSSIPLFFFFTFILWTYCLFNKKQLDKREIIYILLIAMTILFVTVDTYPYWIILITPYMAIMICNCTSNMYQVIFLDTCVGISWLIMKAISTPQCYNLNLLYNMLVKNTDKWSGGLIGLQSSDNGYWNMGLSSFISKFSDVVQLDMNLVRTLARSVFAAALLYFVFCVKPVQDAINIENKKLIVSYRISICACICIIPLLGIVVKVLV